MSQPSAVLAEIKWLTANPEFWQKPATIKEFLGPGYLNLNKVAKEPGVREGVEKALVDIFGAEVDPYVISRVRRAMFTGGIGIGKTTFASIVIPYMVHWVSCLRDPQDYFNLLPGSRIAFMMMSTSENQAVEVLFGDIKARIEHSQWFKTHCIHDEKFTKQLRFPKDIWVLPGSSKETSFEGYNILGGILDEGDSHRETEDKDYAEEGYNTIHSRIASRFIDPDTEDHRGLLCVIGQMKKSSGFMAKKMEELLSDPDAIVARMTIWESLGWNRYTDKETGVRRSFWYDVRRKIIIPPAVVADIMNENTDLLEVPIAYMKDFENKPSKALRDLAGIPPTVESPFIASVDLIDSCFDRWEQRYGVFQPVDEDPINPKIDEDFIATDTIPRALHLDIAYSANGDCAGLVMGHVAGYAEDFEGEQQPYIVIDLIMRIKAAPGRQIVLADLRKIIYNLRDVRGFKIVHVTADGFQSVDTMQQLRKKKFKTQYLSVDRNKQPYEDMREAIQDERMDLPRYMTLLSRGDDKAVNIAKKELTELKDNGRKIDHPSNGSKDCADGIAAVTNKLMGDRKYKKRGRKLDPDAGVREDDTSIDPADLFEEQREEKMLSFREFNQSRLMKAPKPPSNALRDFGEGNLDGMFEGATYGG